MDINKHLDTLERRRLAADHRALVRAQAKEAKERLIEAAPHMKCGHLMEFRQRLQWLSEGMLRNHMEGTINYLQSQKEIEIYRAYKEALK